MQGNKVFVSWSGGKDSYLSLIKAKAAGLEPGSLFTFINRDQACSMSHGLPLQLLQRQARALGIPHVAEPVTWEGYEKGFHRVVAGLRQEGYGGGVFGDINLPEHRQWVEQACSKAGITPYLPLWGMAEEEVLAQLLEENAELLIVALRSDLLEEKWLGSILGQEFIRELRARGISLCGERGEYHTMALDGPFFQERVEVKIKGTRPSGQVLFLDYLL
ncbi:MAG: diphthine--ammonia ligase [Bacillota bacterium]